MFLLDHRARVAVAAACASGLLLAGCTGAAGSAGGQAGGQAAATSGALIAPPATPTGGLEAVPGVVAKLQPSAVTILVDGGNGSGVVYKPDGLIVTNEHVVRGQREVEVAFADGRRVPGRVRAVDPITDLALVQAERTNLNPARFQTELPTVGSLSVVIGSPLGFQNSVTAGIISGVHRELPGSARQGQSLVDLVQTDAPISPGNSGGAVANAQAEVIGIALAYIPPTAGAVALGFAIPAATVVDIIGQLERNGRAQHAYAGLVPSQITPEIAQQLDLPTTEGVVVLNVVPGGPADRAGLRPGDVITAVDGEPTPTPEDFLSLLRPHKPGDTLTLTVRSPGGEERQVRLTVVDRPVAG